MLSWGSKHSFRLGGERDNILIFRYSTHPCYPLKWHQHFIINPQDRIEVIEDNLIISRQTDITMLFSWAHASGLILLYVLFRMIQYVRFRIEYRLPPQVPGVPFFGNLFQMLRSDTPMYMKDLAHKYGELYVISFKPDRHIVSIIEISTTTASL